jgi:hypothetical protein
VKHYFHNLFLSQKFLANIPPPDPNDWPDVPGDDPGGGGTTPPPTFTPGYLGYANPRYRCDLVVNEQVPVIDLMSDCLLPSFRGFLSQGANGKIRLLNKRPVTWGLSSAATAAGDTSIAVDDIRNWITDRSRKLLVDPYTTESEINAVTDANYSTAQNSVSVTASANITVVGFAGCDGNSTPATSTLTVTAVNAGVASNVTIDEVIAFTGSSADTTAGLAEFIKVSINAHPKLRRRFNATVSGSVVAVSGTFGTLVLEDPLVMDHVAPLANPTVAPPVAASSGGTFTAGDYRVAYSYVNLRGQTNLSPVSTVTLTANQKIIITGITLPAGATAVNWYIETGPTSNRIRLHTQNAGIGFSALGPPLLTNTLPPEWNRTGCEVMRVCMAFTDRSLLRTNLTRSNVLRASYEWLLGTRKASINSIVLKFADASDDWRSTELHFNDDDHIAKVKKIEKQEVNGQAINNTFQALRIGSSKLSEFRDADFFYNWSSTREALLLEEGDVVAITDDGSGVINLPVMIEEINIDAGKAGLPRVSFTGQKFSNFLYDDSIADRVTPIVTEFGYTDPVDEFLLGGGEELIGGGEPLYVVH